MDCVERGRCLRGGDEDVRLGEADILDVEGWACRGWLLVVLEWSRLSEWNRYWGLGR